MGAKRLTQGEAIAFLIASGATPLEPFKDTKAPWRSRCNVCQREIEPRLGNVRNGAKPCKYCALGGVTETEAQSIIRELNATPVEAYPGYKSRWRCECNDCGREIEVSLKVARASGRACNYCKGFKNDSGQAIEVMLLNDLQPLEPYKNTHASWLCRCLRCGRETSPSFKKVQLRGHQCGWCARARLDPIEAKDILQKAGVEPIGDYPGSQVRWHSICSKCGRDVFPRVSVVASGIGACVYCAGHKVDEVEASELMVANGVQPLAAYPGASEPWPCTCLNCFREITPTYGNVSKGHTPCVYCARKRIDPKVAFDVSLTRRLKPLEEFPGAVAPWRVKCLKCGRHTSTTWTIINAKKTGSGCSSCTSYGFKPAVPTFLYLIEHETKDAYKVGIANLGSGRMKKHRRNGWQINRLYRFEHGSDAYALEQEIVRWLRRDLLIPPAFTRGDGWTETMPRTSIDFDFLVIEVERKAPATAEKITVQALSSRD